MDSKMLRLATVCLLTGAILGCATTQSPSRPAPQPAAQPQTQQTPQPATEQPKQPSPQPEQNSNQTPAEPAQTPPATETSPAKPSSELIQKGQILVTKEKYQETFDNVRALIEQLNTIIANRDYEAWTQHLTEHYIETFSDPKTLAAISDQPMMKRQNIRLLTLRDYFLNVVVPSRADAHLDDLEFTSKTQVQAITVISGNRYILYNLRLENGSWKIAVS